MNTNNTRWGEGFITFIVNESGGMQTKSAVICKTQYVANPVAVQTEGPPEKPVYLFFV